MLVERNIEFELKGLGPLVKRVLLNPFFLWQKKNFHGKYSSNYLLLKILQQAMHLTSPTWAESLQNLTPKFKIFNVFRTWFV